MEIAITVPHFSLDIGRNESGLATGLAKLGHPTTVLATDLEGVASSVREAKAAIEALPYGFRRLRRVPGTAMNPVPMGARQAVRDSHAELIHSSEDTDMLTVAAFSSSRSLRLPFVLSTERYYVPRFPKSMGYRVIERVWTRRIREEAECVTTHSTVQQSYWRSRGLRRPDPVMIPVGVWTDRFSPGRSPFLRERFHLPEEATVVFTVGRMTDYKDYPTMMRAMQLAVARDHNVHLVVVGFGPQRGRVVTMSRALGLESNVHFATEPIPHAQIPEALRSSDIYLQTSSVEPFGIAVVEAMATGTPVVVSDVGGMSDNVLDGIVGRKFPSGDAERAAAALLELRDAEVRQRLGEAGRRRAVEVFDWDVVCRAYIAIYRRAIEVHSSKQSPPASGPRRASAGAQG